MKKKTIHITMKEWNNSDIFTTREKAIEKSKLLLDSPAFSKVYMKEPVICILSRYAVLSDLFKLSDNTVLDYIRGVRQNFLDGTYKWVIEK